MGKMKVSLKNGRMIIETDYECAWSDHERMLDRNIYKSAMEKYGVSEFDVYVPEHGDGPWAFMTQFDRMLKEQGNKGFFSGLGYIYG